MYADGRGTFASGGVRGRKPTPEPWDNPTTSEQMRQMLDAHRRPLAAASARGSVDAADWRAGARYPQPGYAWRGNGAPLAPFLQGHKFKRNHCDKSEKACRCSDEEKALDPIHGVVPLHPPIQISVRSPTEVERRRR